MESIRCSVHGQLYLGAMAVLSAVLMAIPSALHADSRSWSWVGGDCGGSPGGLLSDETIDVEPGSSVCVLPPSYQMTAELRFYVGVEIEGQYFPGTSAGDLRCKTAAASSVLVHSTTQCTVESGREPGRIDYSPAATNTWFVDHQAMGMNDGTSWGDAFTDLTSALTAATAGDQIWVAEGVYKPGGASPTRSSTFSMKNGVKILGGFDGTETVRSERDPSAHETVLSGDIGTPGVATDNVYHVVHAQSMNSTALLDGFTVTGGRADATAYNDRGGGLFAFSGWPTIVDVNFVDNYAVYGGGVYNDSAPISIVNCGFFGNEAGTATGFGLGGGFYGAGNAEKLVNSVFSGNRAAWQGGGAYWVAGSFGATLRNLTFSRNSAVAGTGGAMYITNNLALNAPWTVANIVAWDNSPDQIVVSGTTTTSINDSLIQGGWAGGSNILTGDPHFADVDGADNDVGTADDDLRLDLASPAVDAGNNAAVKPDETDLDRDGDTTEPVPLDNDFRPRFYDVESKLDTGSGTPPIVDMGAYEAADAVEIDLAIEKTDGFPDCVPGAEVSYWIQAINNSPELITGATVSDPFPAELGDCSWVCEADLGASCAASGTGSIDDSVNLPMNGTVTYIADCTLSSDATGTLSNTATVSVPAGFVDTNPSDNSATDSDTVLTLGSCGSAPDNRTLDGVDIHGTVLIEACDTVMARNTVVIGDVKFKAGQSVILDNGFEVQEDADFEAENNMP